MKKVWELRENKDLYYNILSMRVNRVHQQQKSITQIQNCILCISENLGVVSVFHAELLGAMRAIETTFHIHWTNLC